MGSGKSTIAFELSNAMNIKHFDLDNYIEKNEKSSIKDIFEQKGEAYFRQIEFNAVRSLIIDHKDVIISTGGGTPCFNDAIEMLNDFGTTVYLQMEPIDLFVRLRQDQEKRPLISGMSDQDLKNYIIDTMALREEYYEQAYYTVDGSEDEETVVRAVYGLLNS